MIRILSDSPVVVVAATEYVVKVGQRPGASAADACYLVAFSRDGARPDVPLSGSFATVAEAKRARHEGFTPFDHPQAAAIIAALMAAGMAESRFSPGR